MSMHVHVGLPKCLVLVWFINLNSLRSASCCAFKTMTDLNSLKPCISAFMFEAVAKPAGNANRRVDEVGPAASYQR